MDLKSGIRNPIQLKEAIEIAKQHGENYNDVIWAIHKYKWYNWYQNIYIKADTPDDIENTLLFKDLKENYPEIHLSIESNISYEIDKLNNDID